MANFWEQLSIILSSENKELIARTVLKALSLDQDHEVKIEVIDHHLHKIYLSQCEGTFHKSSKNKAITCKT